MLSGFLLMAGANAGVCLVAAALAEKTSPSSAPLRSAIFLLIRLLLISISILAAGLCGTLTPLGLGLPWILAGAGVLVLRRPGCLSLPLRSWDPIAVAALSLALLLVGAHVWFLAPAVRDVMTYHLPKIGEWVIHGGFTPQWGQDPRSTFPSGFEFVETWWVVFLRHDVLIEMAGLEFLALAALSAGAAGRGLGLSPRASSMAAAGTALCPGLLLQAGSCLNDGPVAALLAATLALVLARAPWPLLLLPLGLGAGIKPTFLYALPGLAFLAWTSRREGRAFQVSPRWLWALGSLSLAAGLFWYARNTVQFGNPLHPATPSGVMSGNHEAQHLGPRLSSLWHNFRRLADNRIYDREPYGPMMELIAGWGPAGLCGLAALFAAAREAPAFGRLALAGGLSLGSVFLLVISDAWNMRFVLFAAPLLALGFARYSESRPAMRALAAACFALQALGVLLPASLPENGLRDLAKMPWRSRRIDAFSLADLPAGRIAVLPGPGLPSYSLYRPDFSRDVVYLAPRTADELEADLDRLGIDGFLADESSLPARSLRDRGRWKRNIGSLHLRTRP